MKSTKQFPIFAIAASALLVVWGTQPATAGNKAQVSPTGVGKVEASISYNGVLVEAKNPASGVSGSTSVNLPAAGVYSGTTPAGFPSGGVSAGLPADCPSTVYCTVTTERFTGGYKAVVRSSVTAGAIADNPELELKIPIIPAACASYDVQTDIIAPVSGTLGKLQLTGEATSGTAVWLRALLYTGSVAGEPTREELLANSILKGELVVAGPFNTVADGGCPLTVPVTIDDPTKLYLLVDAVAKSAPYTMTCQDPVTLSCANLQYPVPTIMGGCASGESAMVTYDIPANTLPFNKLTKVTARATKDGGTIATCTFTATLEDKLAPVITATGTPANGTLSFNPTAAQIEVALGTATATDNCGTVTPTVQTSPVTASGCSRTQTRTWTATDAAGNAAAPVSRTVTWTEDTTPPVITASGVPADGILGMNPTAAQIEAALGTATATDGCGAVTPTAQTSLVTASGCTMTQTRTWAATDAAGNQAVAVSRTVAWMADTTPPLTPVLPTVSGGCSAPVTLTAPTTTDNCAGTVTGTTSDPLTYTARGTYTVHWTFGDGNGNSTTANQTVIVTGLTFKGFYTPIGTVSNSYATAVSANWGRTLPIKFDMLCGTTYVTGGTPPVVEIQKMASDNVTVGSAIRVPAVYQNDWHYNWPTDTASRGDVYKFTVILPDGSKPYVFVRFK